MPKVNYKEIIPWNIKDVAFVYVFVLAIIVFLVSLLIILGVDEESKLLTVGVDLFGSLVLIYSIFLILKEKYSVSIQQSLGLYKNKILPSFNQGVGIFMLLVIATTAINYFLAPILDPQTIDPYSKLSDSELKTMSFFAILTAPLVEEVFFRGFMQPAFIKRFGVILGIILTALVFGFSHAYYLEHTLALVTVFSIGLILGIAKYKTQSIMPGFFAHLLNNIFAAMMMF